jgi:uncharacterized integral membrane protein
MRIVRWMLLAALAMAFLMLALANWVPVGFVLPTGRTVQLPLPLLLGAALVAGWLPTVIWYWLSGLIAPRVGKPRDEQVAVAPPAERLP